MRSNLDINKRPEAFSRVERAIHFNNMVAHEIGVESWVTDLPIAAGKQEFLGVDPIWLSIEDGAFLEGFLAAVAFCSGSASSGKIMDVSAKTWLPDVLHRLLNTAKSAMEAQTIWEQNVPQPPGGAE